MKKPLEVARVRAESRSSLFFKSSSSSAPFFQPKLQVGQPGDHLEQEADRVADQVMSARDGRGPSKKGPLVHGHAAPHIQRDEKDDKTGDVLAEGAGTAYEQLKDQPGFEQWKERQTEQLKLKLWENQPTEFKAGIVTFGLANLGILGTTFALDPRFRTSTIDLLEDKNILLPLSLLPYSEYFALSGFKYKLPTAEYAPYTFQTEFNFDAWFELMQEKWNIPKATLSAGVESAFSEQGGFTPFTGGFIKLKLGGGVINLQGFYNQTLPPTPMLISDPASGQSPVWLMRTLPEQLEANLPKGSGVFLTVDVLRVPDLFRSELPKKKEKEVQRKAKDGDRGRGFAGAAPRSVRQELDSGSGQTLEPHTLSLMERRFGYDFSGVRIHTGNSAADSAQAINAKAYTSGDHIVFNAGEYRPDTPSGQRLLAHELAHTLQQTPGVKRKELTETPQITRDLKDELQQGRYSSAYLKLNDYLDWKGDRAKKEWLAKNPEIRFLFLKHRPAVVVADVYSAEELLLMAPAKAFSIIDTWLQKVSEKQDLYAAKPLLFDYLLASISPYTGVAIDETVKRLIAIIDRKKKYEDDSRNPEFDILHLLAPTVERKIRFYDEYEELGLLKTVRRKFDPFTGFTIATMEDLTDTNEVDRKKAQKIYDKLKPLSEERRRVFLETALFAGALEADKDARTYYKKKFKESYKALPHNWDFAFWFWNWGEAPFADRVTVDHVALMSAALFYEDLELRKFGFDRGIDDTSGKSVTDPEGKRITDSTRLIRELKDDRNFNDPKRLAILLSIAVRGGLEKTVTSEVLVPKNAAKPITGDTLAVVEHYGFVATENFTYRDDAAKQAKHNSSRTWYIVTRTLFKWHSGKVFGEQRGTFDLRRLQDTKEHLGSLGGIRFGTQAYQNDEFYNKEWLDQAVRAHSGSSTLVPNIEETKGSDRRGKIFASIRNDIRQANIFASTLPIEGLNYFGGGSLYRSGPGVLQGLQVHLSWTKDTSDPDNSIQLQVDIENLLLNQLELIAPASTLSIGVIHARGFRIRLSQNKLAAAKGLFIGMLKNADFTLNALLTVLPRMLTLLPYAVNAMVEEFKGAKAHKYKDALGEILKKDFSALDASVTFTKVAVRNIYDTAGGFLDDITIEEFGKDKNPVRQGVRIQENTFWSTDALFHLREKIRLINEEIRAAKSELTGTDHAARMTELEAAKQRLLSASSKKSLQHEDRSEEMNQLREIMRELRRLEGELNELFKQAVRDNPLYNPMVFKELEAERERMTRDLDYIDKQYWEDKKLAAEGSGAVQRFEARRRVEAFEAKYKSVSVRLALRGIKLHGGNYVRDLINDALKSVGFIDPQLEGIENINITAVDSSFIASGAGVSREGTDAGVAIRNLHLPLIRAKAIAFKTETMLFEAGKPLLENVFVSVRMDFVKNPLAKDPAEPYSFILKSLYVGRAVLNGLTVKIGDADPLLDFPATMPVEAWGLRLWNYDPKAGVINLKIQDVRAIGIYSDKTPDKETGEPQSTRVAFGVDSTIDDKPRNKKLPAALDLRYDPSENSMTTKVNLRSAWVSSLTIDSPTLKIWTTTENRAVQLDNLVADVKVTFAKEAQGDQPEAPPIVDIHSLHVDKLTAHGLTLQFIASEETETAKAKKKGPKTIQEVALSETDPVEIEQIDLKGLRIVLDKDQTRLGATDENASIEVGKGDVGGVVYKETTLKGSVLQSFNLKRGKFDSIELAALNRKGRSYTLKQFLQFFGRTRLAGADIEAAIEKGKTSATFGLKGKKDAKGRNIPIAIDYVEPTESTLGYYKIRLPLARITLPALDIEKDGHRVVIPRSKNPANVSTANDVDVKLSAYVDFDAEGKVIYDVYLESLDIADLKVYGLEYHNDAKGIHVVLDPVLPLHIPNVKAGGFRFSSWKAFDVFGKDGGWIKAAAEENEVISAHVDSISAAFTDGKFLAERDPASGRTALDVDIGSFGFKFDKSGTMTFSLGKIAGGFPKMSVSTKDPATGATSVITIATKTGKTIVADSVDITLDSDGNKIIDATGLKAGELTITSTDTLGKEVSTKTLKLGPEALGAASAQVRLNQDKSKEISIKDIRGGLIDVDLIATGAKGKSENYITLPDKELVIIKELKIAIDPDGHRKFTVVEPTLKKVKWLSPSQTTKGDYVQLVVDLEVKGNVELGDGNFDTLTFAAPYDAFIGMTAPGAPVEIKNVKLEIQHTPSTEAAKEEAKPLTEDQNKLIELEEARDRAHSEMLRTPAEFHHGDHSVENPEFWEKAEAFQKARQAYEDHKASMIAGAKKVAKTSMTRKYLEAVSGTVNGTMKVFDSVIPLKIETYKGEHYVELSSTVTAEIKKVIQSVVKTTADMPFWSSEEMKAIGKGLQRWWVSGSPTASADVDSIAAGNAFGVVTLLLRDILMWPGLLETDKSLYGINLNIEGYWALDLTSYDSIGIGLCEVQYKHPEKDDFYSLYGIIEYLGYVSPTLTSARGRADSERLKELAKGTYRTSEEIGEMGIAAAVNELVLFIRANLAREALRLKNAFLKNIKRINVTADVSLRPQEVITELLKEYRKGSFTFKGKGTIEDVHITGDYVNRGVPQATAKIGGAKGKEDIVIPGATYLSEKKDVKVTYDAVQVAPASLSYEQDVYKVNTSAAKIDGLKFGLKKGK